MKKKNSFFVQLQYRAFARVVRKVRGDDFCRAESYPARDNLCRLLAAECYEVAEQFARAGNEKYSLQYMKLAARLLGLSLRPKKLSDLEEIKKAVGKLKAERASK